MSEKTPEFFTDEFGNSYFLAYRNEAGSAYRVVPREGTSPLANAPRSDEERRELVRQFGSIENFGVALLDIVERLNRAVPYGLEDFAVLVDAAAEIERLRQSVIEMRQLLDDFWKTCTEEHSSVEMFVLHRAAGHAIARAYDAVPEEARRG